MFHINYEINHVSFDTLVLADSAQEALEMAADGIKQEAGEKFWQIVNIEEVSMDLEKYMDF